MRRLPRPTRHALIGAGIALTILGAARADAATWSALQPAAHPRSEGTFVVHDGGAFHLNGFDGDIRIQNSIERYDIATDTWQTVAETTDSPGFPTALTHQGTVVVDGEMWLIGGRIGASPGRVTDRVVIFDLETYGWRDGPALPIPFAGGGAALLGRRIHAFGGLDAKARCDVDTHLVYDLDAPAAGWQDLSGDAPFPSPRNHFGTVVLDGRIYVVGGQIGHDNCDALAKQRVQTPLVHVYDPADNDWDRLADLPWSQSHTEPSTFAHADRIWLAGGLVRGERVLSYEPAADRWTWRDDLDLPSALLAPGARIFGGNRLHVFGGGAPNVRDPRRETWVTDVPGLARDASDGAPDTGRDDPVDAPEIDTPEASEEDSIEVPEEDPIEIVGDDPIEALEDDPITAPEDDPAEVSEDDPAELPESDTVEPADDDPLDIPTADVDPIRDEPARPDDERQHEDAGSLDGNEVSGPFAVKDDRAEDHDASVDVDEPTNAGAPANGRDDGEIREIAGGAGDSDGTVDQNGSVDSDGLDDTVDTTASGGSGGGMGMWLAALLALRIGTGIATRRAPRPTL